MTINEQHEAGRALDALVAQRVMGHEVEFDPDHGIEWWESRDGHMRDLLPYSIDASAAMLVVEKINDLTDMTWNPFAEPGTEWAVRFSRAAYAPTLPLAICRAALAAAGESDE